MSSPPSTTSETNGTSTTIKESDSAASTSTSSTPSTSSSSSTSPSDSSASNSASTSNSDSNSSPSSDSASTSSSSSSSSSVPLPSSPSHPLQNQWTYWYNPPNKASPSGEWKSNTRDIFSFDTVEDFWRLFNVLKPATSLTAGSGYHLFKQGILPEWEHEENRNGGKWSISFPKRDGGAKADEAWLYTLLALIGEQFEDSDEITGAVIGPRQKEYRVALWTRTSEPTITKRIGQLWKNLLAYHDKIGYQLHNDAIEKGTSYNNPKSYMI